MSARRLGEAARIPFSLRGQSASVLVDDATLAPAISERLGSIAEAATADEAKALFVVQGTVASGQPMLVVDQQGVVLSRARNAEGIIDAVAALVGGFEVDETKAKFAGRIIRRPDGDLTVVEPWPGRGLAGLTPRLAKADHPLIPAIEYGIDSDGSLRIGTQPEPVPAHSIVLFSPELASDHLPYLAAARVCLQLITDVPADQRPETLRRIALLIESLAEVRTVESFDPALLFAAVTAAE